MLNSLRIKNFRRIDDSTMHMTPGLNVVRGNNEMGKSTRIEAILFAMFGAKSLRNSLKETVTWGVPEGKLAVELSLQVGEDEITFKRSKAGAEVYKNDQLYVTGQNEVSSFAAQIMGGDAQTTNKLMFANQGNIRGALEQGPKAAIEMIEGLSDFDFFDTLIEKMGQKLVLGSDAFTAQRLAEAEEALATVNTTSYATDIATMKGSQADLDANVEKAQARVEMTKQEIEPKREELQRGQQALMVLNTARQKISDIDEQVVRTKARIAEEAGQVVDVDLSPIRDWERQIELANQHEATLAIFKNLQKLMASYPESYWEGDKDGLLKTQESDEADHARIAKVVSTLKDEIREISAMIQPDTNCKACGQPLKDHEKVKENNARYEAQVSKLKVELAAQSENLQELSSNLAAYKQLEKDARPFERFLSENSALVTADVSQYPARLSWKGDAPSEDGVDVSGIKRQISDLQARNQAALKAKANVAAQQERLQDLEGDKEKAALALANCEAVPDIDALKREVERLSQLNIEEIQKWNDAKEAAYSNKIQVENLLRLQDLQKQKQESLENQIEQFRKDSRQLEFNNALLKKVKESRPLVANKLWNLVLSSVSTVFSKMRNEQSVVTREKDGFRVNGQSISSLSGSTLDLLGLAIRFSLIKIFVPGCQMVSLDEPFAACDDDRAALMLSAIKNSGFDQILLITHEEISSGMADNLINI